MRIFSIYNILLFKMIEIIEMLLYIVLIKVKIGVFYFVLLYEKLFCLGFI